MACTLDSFLLKCNLYTYEYFLQADVCRLCLERNSMLEIVSNIVYLNGVKMEVMDVIQECLDLDLCDQNYPNKVCDQCWEFVKKFYCFKIFCKEADRKLREVIANGCGPTVLLEDTIEVKEEAKSEGESDIFNFENHEKSDEVKIKKTCRPTKQVATNKPTRKPRLVKSIHKIKKSKTYCHICCTDYDDIKNFTEHNSECHGIENGLYKCFGCEKRFKNTRTRTSHETNFCKALREGYKCPLCDRFLPLRKLYEAHMRYHAGKENDVMLELSENIFKCRKCDATFRTKDTLKEHMATHATVDDNFVCETCGHVFLRQDYLQKHIMIHTGLKRHVCTYCGLRFVQKSSLNVHLRKHTGERPYKCDVCPQRCVSSSNLRAHRRRHLGIKQFECAICSKKFGYKMSLAEHLAAAHAPAQKHQCALCGATYSRKKGLQRHAARKHAEQGLAVAENRVDENGSNAPASDHADLLANSL